MEIVHKIKKLFSLATSSNENEARVAAAKANELLIKYNFSRQEIKHRGVKYENVNTNYDGYNFTAMHLFIAGVLQDFFFVKVMRNQIERHDPDPKTKRISLIGEKHNCEIASYVFDFLSETYPRLWRAYKKENNAHSRQKTSFYKGLTDGICKTLEQTKQRVEKEGGLIVRKDEGLMKFALSLARLTSKSRTYHVDPDVINDGYEEGKKIKIKRGIEKTGNQNRQKYLT